MWHWLFIVDNEHMIKTLSDMFGLFWSTFSDKLVRIQLLTDFISESWWFFWELNFFTITEVTILTGYTALLPSSQIQRTLWAEKNPVDIFSLKKRLQDFGLKLYQT